MNTIISFIPTEKCSKCKAFGGGGICLLNHNGKEIPKCKNGSCNLRLINRPIKKEV